MEPKKILLLCDQSDTDVVEKSFSDTSDYDITTETTEKILSYGVRDYLERTINLINRSPEVFDGVVGTHDSSAIFAAIICKYTGKSFATPKAVIQCQNKYICRRIQQECIPENTPRFLLALDYLKDPSKLPSPFFIKPVRSNISFCAHIISTPEELEYYIGRETQDIIYYNQYFMEALSILDPEERDQLNLDTCNHFLCEELVSGDQVTVDGFVFKGRVKLFGITRAVFHENSNSFSHHEFPCDLSEEMEEIITRKLSYLITRLGIDNSFFNVELRINEEEKSFYIIEVNSRIAFQFAKTIQVVKGFDPLHLLCDIATGREPNIKESSSNTFRYCFNFELHAFEDQKILKTPTQSGYEEVMLRYPGVHIRNLIQEDHNLSDYKHNPESFRYCVLDIPGNSKQEIMEKYQEVVALLKYEFEEIA